MCPVLSPWLSGLGLEKGSGTTSVSMSTLQRMLRSSTNFRLIAGGSEEPWTGTFFWKRGHAGLGIAGLIAAPLNLMIKKILPRKTPCGEDPGSDLLEEEQFLNFRTIDLSVR